MEVLVADVVVLIVNEIVPVGETVPEDVLLIVSVELALAVPLAVVER